ncbi:MAG: alkane 1-monooxygenase [Thalassovita sp.]
MHLFAFATLLPAVCLCLGAVLGGLWVWAGLLLITVGCYAVDRLSHGDAVRRKDGAEFPAGDALSSVLAVLHLPMLLLAGWAIASESILSGPERVALLIGFGLFFGQVGHPNAHELIHRPNKWLRALGAMTYATLLIGHHVSAHRLVHHVHVGTDRDPNSAWKGEGFWRFLLRAWPGSFVAGLRAERALRKRSARGPRKINPYLIYLIWYVTTLSLSYALAGSVGILVTLMIASYAQIQIFLADYIQHYGLRRKLDAQGKPEPVGPQHSWNSPHLGSSTMMLNAPRHSDHHLHPSRHYPALQLENDMPKLPYSLPVMALIALVPPLWRSLMKPRIEAVEGG